MKIFYHNDADGKCAARLVYEKSRWLHPLCISMDYHNEFPLHIIQQDEEVWIVDFSVAPGIMSALLDRTKEVRWIDHHVSAIQKLHGFKHISGIRTVSFSGSELTWIYLNKHIYYFGNYDELSNEALSCCPSYVRLIGDRDTWTFQYGDDSRAYHEAFRLAGEPLPDDDESWEHLQNTEARIQEGIILLQYSRMLNRNITKSWAYEVDFEGYTILACNSPIFSSDLFGDRYQNYPFVAIYCHNGERYKVSMYSDNMDIVHIAERYGGGGHPRACGFTSLTLPFTRNNHD